MHFSISVARKKIRTFKIENENAHFHRSTISCVLPKAGNEIALEFYLLSSAEMHTKRALKDCPVFSPKWI